MTETKINKSCKEICGSRIRVLLDCMMTSILKRTYLVTGGAGFIGSHLCEALLEQGGEVICLDNLCDFYDPDIKLANLRNMLSQPNFSFIKADIRDAQALNHIFSFNNIDMLIHIAAMAGVRPSIQNPDLYYDVNLMGTLRLLEMCRAYGVNKLVFASSSSVYGNNRVPFSESDPVDNPISPYAASKKAAELMCHTWHYLHDISTICLRFFTVYGPRQRPDLAIHKFARDILADRAITMFGSGSSARDYTYVDDIIQGVIKAIERLEDSSEKLYEIYNLGNSSPITLQDMIKRLEHALGKKAKIRCKDMQPGDVECTYADISKAEEALHYKPQTEFEEGLAKFCSWLMQNTKD